MRMRIYKKRAFTLVELMIVVLILGALTVIAVPRITGGAQVAKISSCETNVDMINSQIELYYQNTGDWPNNLKKVTDDPNYFPDTTAPACPLGTAYNYNASNRIDAHSH